MINSVFRLIHDATQQVMLAVGRMDKLSPPHRGQAIEPHQSAHPVSAHWVATLCHGSAKSAATVGFMAGSKGRFEVDAGSAQCGLGQALLEHCNVCVVARAADIKDTARLAKETLQNSLSCVLGVSPS